MPTRPSPADLKQRLLQRAHELGFDLAGITTPDPPPHTDVFERWLAAGRNGEMGYLARPHGRAARRQPRRLLPECESLLVVAMNYLPAHSSAGPSGPARVSNYAVGDDYHAVIPAKLERLVSDLEAWVGEPIPHRIYTDTGPILERELAQRAGLGWIGKNTCLIHPRRGSYFFLAEVLLGLPLPSDVPLTSDHCGSCTRCLQACPTQCIRPDRTLDADRCISYLTIELRGAIPAGLRAQTSGWVFGCDVCQQVCPWNQRFAVPTAEPAFQTRPFFRTAGLADYLELTPEVYQDTFRGSPLKRAKRRGLARNAAVAAGQQEQAGPAELDGLRTALRDPEPLVRQHAAWALGEKEAADAHAALEAALAVETNVDVIAEIEAALPR
jgi:epoxyqueuosine reductase